MVFICFHFYYILDLSEYLGITSNDQKFLWIVEEMFSDPLPSSISLIIDPDSRIVKFVDESDPLSSTLTHPHFEKYQTLLTVAREQNPSNDWKSCVSFQLEVLAVQATQQRTLAEKQYLPVPPLETPARISEVARIFRISLREEPYLVFCCRSILRHAYRCIHRGFHIGGVKDFLHLISKTREEVNEIKTMHQQELDEMAAALTCVECREVSAELFCEQCRDTLCIRCFSALHRRGNRVSHTVTELDSRVCSECSERVSRFRCLQCRDSFCHECFQLRHLKGNRRNHIPVVLRTAGGSANHYTTSPVTLPPDVSLRNTATHNIASIEGGLDEQINSSNASSLRNIVGIRNSGRLLRVLTAPWTCLSDHCGIPLYWNVMNDSQVRNPPIGTLNIGLEEAITKLSLILGGDMNETCGLSS